MSGPPRTIASPSRLMIVNCWGADAVFFDLDTLGEIARFPLPPQPHEIRHDPKRGLVYVSCPYKDGFYDVHEEKAHDLVVVDPVAMEVVDVVDLSPEAGPHGLCLDEANDLLWMSVESGGGAVIAMDLQTRRTVARIGTGVDDGRPHWLTMSADGGTLYVANKESRSMSVIDVKSGEVAKLVPMPGGSEDLELSADGSRLYVSSRELPKLHVIDTATLEECGEVPLDDLPGRVYLTSDDKLLVTFFHFPYQTRGRVEQGRLGLVDPEALTQGRTITVGRGPMDLTTTVDGSLAYVTNSRSGTVYEIDLVGELDVRRAVRTGPVGHASHGVLLL